MLCLDFGLWVGLRVLRFTSFQVSVVSEVESSSLKFGSMIVVVIVLVNIFLGCLVHGRKIE